MGGPNKRVLKKMFKGDQRMSLLIDYINTTDQARFADGLLQVNTGGSWSTINAEMLATNTANFANLLSPADDTIQKALDTLDDHTHDSRYYLQNQVDTLLAGKSNTNHNHDADYKAIGYTPTWAEITDKPSTFTPTAHNHNDLYFTETEITSLLAGKSDTTHNHDADYKAISYTPTWAEITDKPSTFTPTAHNHNDLYFTETEITNLLAGKSDTTHNHDADYKAISYAPTLDDILGNGNVSSKDATVGNLTAEDINASGKITVSDASSQLDYTVFHGNSGAVAGSLVTSMTSLLLEKGANYGGKISGYLEQEVGGGLKFFTKNEGVYAEAFSLSRKLATFTTAIDHPDAVTNGQSATLGQVHDYTDDGLSDAWLTAQGSVTDLNTAYTQGQFAWNATTANTPYSYGTLLNYVSSGKVHNNVNNWLTQIAISTNNRIDYRIKINSADFSTWSRLYTTLNANLSTVDWTANNFYATKGTFTDKVTATNGLISDGENKFTRSSYVPALILDNTSAGNKVVFELRNQDEVKWEMGTRPSTFDFALYRKTGNYYRALTVDYGTGNVIINSKTDNGVDRFQVKDTKDAFINISSPDTYEAGVKLRQSSTYGADVYYNDEITASNSRGLYFDMINGGIRQTALSFNRVTGSALFPRDVTIGGVGAGSNAPCLHLQTSSGTTTSYQALIMAKYDWGNPFVIRGYSGTDILSQNSGNTVTRLSTNSSVGLELNGAIAYLNYSGATRITTTSAGATVSGTLSTAAYQLNGTDINTAGTLSNVAYKNQNNAFSASQTIETNGSAYLRLKDSNYPRYATWLYNGGTGLTEFYHYSSGSTRIFAADEYGIYIDKGNTTAGNYIPSGMGGLYNKGDGKIYFKEYGGTEYDLTAGAGAGSGTVTSVAISSSDLAITGTNPITTSGTFNLEIKAGAVGATEIASGAVGVSEIAADAVTASKLDNSVIADQALANTLESTDCLMYSYYFSGVDNLRKMEISTLQTYMQNNLSFGTGGTSYTSGDGIKIASDTISVDIAGTTALTSGLIATDELLISDAGTLKRIDVSVLQSYMQSNLSTLWASSTSGVYSTSNVGIGAGASSTYNLYVTGTSKFTDIIMSLGDIMVGTPTSIRLSGASGTIYGKGLTLEEVSSHAIPASGTGALYIKSGELYFMKSTGTEIKIS